MKKNLISAVAAGLALALAITSFGCESGNDTPVHLAYTRARYEYDPVAAKEAGDVFTYVAKPTNKLWNSVKEPTSATTGDAWAFDGTESAGYTLTTDAVDYYKDGVQAYNVCTGTFTDKEDYKLEAGKVVNTLTETLVFDAAEGTFEWFEDSSEWSCKKVIFVTDETYTALKGKKGYLRIPGIPASDFDINNAINVLSPGDLEYKAAKSYREAGDKEVFYVESVVTVKGFAIRINKFVTEDGDILYCDDLSDSTDPTDPGYVEPAPNATGTFTIDGTYAAGKILLTSWKTGTTLYTFDDDSGTYTVTKNVGTANPSFGDNPVKTDIARDFPEKTTDPGSSRIPTYNYTADVFCKTGRTLNIDEKTVTANKIKTNLYTEEDKTAYTFDILLSSSNQSYERTDYDKIPYLAKSYEYVLQD